MGFEPARKRQAGRAHEVGAIRAFAFRGDDRRQHELKKPFLPSRVLAYREPKRYLRFAKRGKPHSAAQAPAGSFLRGLRNRAPSVRAMSDLSPIRVGFGMPVDIRLAGIFRQVEPRGLRGARETRRVIASAAEQPTPPPGEAWIASAFAL